MPGGEDDLQLQAGLDNQAVITAIEEMEVSATKMLLDADKNMQRLGVQTLQTAKAMEKHRDVTVSSMGTTVAAYKKGEETIAELRKEITRLGGDIKEAADEAKDFSYGEIEFEGDKMGISKIHADDIIATGEVISKMEEIEDTAKRLMQSVSAEARQQGIMIAASLDVIGNAKKPIEEIDKDLNDLLGTTKRVAKDFDTIGKKELFKEVNVKKFKGRIHELRGTISTLKKSTSADARAMGVELEKAAVKTWKAWRRGAKGIDAADKEIKELNQTGKETNRIYGDKMPKAVGRSTASVWKMSAALDRVGIRGAGGALRVVDAIKSIHPAAIVAVIGVLAIGKAIQVVTKLAINLAKKMVKLFIGLNKDALELAKSYEVVELQLRNIFRGKVALARDTLGKIMELGAELGVDLSERLTQVFLPLVDSFAQFEKLAKGAATLAAKTGKDMDQTGRAFQQAVAGQFRALQYQFFVTADHIKNIKELQEELGATEGLIQGMEEYFEATGTGWDTFENSLRRVQGQLTETFNLFKFQLGEPIKIALTEQLIGIRDWINDNQDMIKQFFRDIGEAVADAITTVGEFSTKFLDAIDQEELDAIAIDFQILAESIEQMLGGVTGSEADSFIQSLIGIADYMSLIVSYMRGLFHSAAFVASLFIAGPVGFAWFGAEQFDKLEGVKQERKELEKRREILEREFAIRRALGDQTVQNLDDQRDAALWLNKSTAERNILLERQLELSEEISDAYGDFAKDTSRDLRDMGVELSRRAIDNQIDMSRKREDLYRKHAEKVLEIFVKSEISVREQLIDAGDKSLDIFIADMRKRAELDIEKAKKKEELERKHQERLSKIRDKFEFDAREAIRQNDAVALFRLRRKLEFDLIQENKKHDSSVDDADRAAKDKRDKLDRQLRYEEEDLDESNRRKLAELQRRLDDQLEAERVNHEESLAQLNVEEERKIQDLNKWWKREREDYATMLRDKLADLKDNMADQITEYQNTLASIQAINSSIVSNMAAGLQAAIGSFSGAGLLGSFMPPQIQGLFGGVVGGIGGIGGAPVTSGYVPGQGTLASEPQLRGLAVDLAKQLNKPTSYFKALAGMSNRELSHAIEVMQNELNKGGHQTQFVPGISHQHGGIENVGVMSRVGEAGPEARLPAQHGIIAPHAPFMMPSQMQPNVSSVVDNSRNLSASIDMLDPTQVSEIQKTLWRATVTEQLLAIEGGG